MGRSVGVVWPQHDKPVTGGRRAQPDNNNNNNIINDNGRADRGTQRDARIFCSYLCVLCGAILDVTSQISFVTFRRRRSWCNICAKITMDIKWGEGEREGKTGKGNGLD